MLLYSCQQNSRATLLFFVGVSVPESVFSLPEPVYEVPKTVSGLLDAGLILLASVFGLD
jgi:hypothetical protein